MQAFNFNFLGAVIVAIRGDRPPEEYENTEIVKEKTKSP